MHLGNKMWVLIEGVVLHLLSLGSNRTCSSTSVLCRWRPGGNRVSKLEWRVVLGSTFRTLRFRLASGLELTFHINSKFKSGQITHPKSDVADLAKRERSAQTRPWPCPEPAGAFGSIGRRVDCGWISKCLFGWVVSNLAWFNPFGLPGLLCFLFVFNVGSTPAGLSHQETGAQIETFWPTLAPSQ